MPRPQTPLVALQPSPSPAPDSVPRLSRSRPAPSSSHSAMTLRLDDSGYHYGFRQADQAAQLEAEVPWGDDADAMHAAPPSSLKAELTSSGIIAGPRPQRRFGGVGLGAMGEVPDSENQTTPQPLDPAKSLAQSSSRHSPPLRPLPVRVATRAETLDDATSLALADPRMAGTLNHSISVSRLVPGSWSAEDDEDDEDDAAEWLRMRGEASSSSSGLGGGVPGSGQLDPAECEDDAGSLGDNDDDEDDRRSVQSSLEGSIVSVGLAQDEAVGLDVDRPSSPMDPDLLIGAHLPPAPHSHHPSHHSLTLSRLLGVGASAAVYLATSSLNPSSHYAAKALFPTTPAAAAMGRVERTALGRLRDVPGVVRCHRVLEAHGATWMVLEFCPRDLYEEIVDAGEAGPGWERGAGGMAEERTRLVVGEVLRALEQAHARGVWHRDVKPENVLIGEDNLPRLADFGLAHLSATLPPPPNSSRSASLNTGSLRYMPPELLHASSVSLSHLPASYLYDCAASDAWAAGVVAVNCLAGRCPWERADAAVCPEYADYAALPTPRHRAAFLAREFAMTDQAARVVAGLLEPSPRDRWTVGQARREWESCVRVADRRTVMGVEVPGSAAPPEESWGDGWPGWDDGRAESYATAREFEGGQTPATTVHAATPRSYTSAKSWVAAASGKSWGDLEDEEEMDWGSAPIPTFGSDGEEGEDGAGEGGRDTTSGPDGDNVDSSGEALGGRGRTSSGGRTSMLFEFDEEDAREFTVGGLGLSVGVESVSREGSVAAATPEPDDLSGSAYFVPLRDGPGTVRRVSRSLHHGDDEHRAVVGVAVSATVVPVPATPPRSATAAVPSITTTPDSDGKKRKKKRRHKAKGDASSGVGSGVEESPGQKTPRAAAAKLAPSPASGSAARSVSPSPAPRPKDTTEREKKDKRAKAERPAGEKRASSGADGKAAATKTSGSKTKAKPKASSSAPADKDARRDGGERKRMAGGERSGKERRVGA